MNDCCKYCDERKVGCHSKCSKYKHFVEELHEVKKKIKKEQDKYNNYFYHD